MFNNRFTENCFTQELLLRESFATFVLFYCNESPLMRMRNEREGKGLKELRLESPPVLINISQVILIDGGIAAFAGVLQYFPEFVCHVRTY